MQGRPAKLKKGLGGKELCREAPNEALLCIIATNGNKRDMCS